LDFFLLFLVPVVLMAPVVPEHFANLTFCQSAILSKLFLS
jgi:hypothetical protein